MSFANEKKIAQEVQKNDADQKKIAQEVQKKAEKVAKAALAKAKAQSKGG